ncbi:hypothetical protein [Chenggangzhangella methanolivorans]|uniref:Uncharacterized protein n=1 Tax=Chenggangzhangella methanolivorans TaxID=1437009 RepID=A0A9E6RFD9_9HYPH|nr:hypothetical protein [Chenggangzhangella methanolivorans]QZO02559.1 hypothetical protein K6K41_20810 [Chenggangzhangella methanolivorans]
MNEDVRPAIVRLDKAVTLFSVEEFNRTALRHRSSPSSLPEQAFSPPAGAAPARRLARRAKNSTERYLVTISPARWQGEKMALLPLKRLIPKR